jgi:recombinational DNA repair protein RecR
LDGADVIITRLARGLPVGARLEYLHGDILADAYGGRRKLDI